MAKFLLNSSAACPFCQAKIAGTVSETAPHLDSIIVCHRCGELSTFDVAANLRELTGTEIVAAMWSFAWPDIVK